MRLPAAVAFLIQSLPVQSSQPGASSSPSSSLGSRKRPIDEILRARSRSGNDYHRGLWQDLDEIHSGEYLGKVEGGSVRNANAAGH